jgi:hypothetical protein
MEMFTIEQVSGEIADLSIPFSRLSISGSTKQLVPTNPRTPPATVVAEGSRSSHSEYLVRTSQLMESNEMPLRWSPSGEVLYCSCVGLISDRQSKPGPPVVIDTNLAWALGAGRKIGGNRRGPQLLHLALGR